MGGLHRPGYGSIGRPGHLPAVPVTATGVNTEHGTTPVAALVDAPGTGPDKGEKVPAPAI